MSVADNRDDLATDPHRRTRTLSEDDMAGEALNESLLTEVFMATPHLLRFPKEKVWVDYDKEADFLYLTF